MTPAPAMLKLPEVVRRTGLSRSTIYVRMNDGQFPQQVKLGVRAAAWLESEVSDYITSCVAAHRQQPSKTASATRTAA